MDCCLQTNDCGSSTRELCCYSCVWVVALYPFLVCSPAAVPGYLVENSLLGQLNLFSGVCVIFLHCVGNPLIYFTLCLELCFYLYFDFSFAYVQTKRTSVPWLYTEKCILFAVSRRCHSSQQRSYRQKCGDYGQLFHR